MEAAMADSVSRLTCDIDVYLKGKEIAILDGDEDKIERWIQVVARITKVGGKLDWHFETGRAIAKYLGKDEELFIVYEAMKKLSPAFQGKGIRVIRKHLPTRILSPRIVGKPSVVQEV